MRLRRGAEPAALRPFDCQRATAAPPGRAVASPGPGGPDHGLQFPGCRLGLECHACAGLWRRRGLEAVGEGAALRHGLPDDCRARAGGNARGAARPARPGRRFRVRRRSGPGCQRSTAVGLGHRFGADGPRRGPDSRRSAGPFALGTWREQRHGRGAFRRFGTGHSRDRICRRRHGWPTLHDPAAVDRPRERCRTLPEKVVGHLPTAAYRQSAG